MPPCWYLHWSGRGILFSKLLVLGDAPGEDESTAGGAAVDSGEDSGDDLELMQKDDVTALSGGIGPGLDASVGEVNAQPCWHMLLTPPFLLSDGRFAIPMDVYSSGLNGAKQTNTFGCSTTLTRSKRSRLRFTAKDRQWCVTDVSGSPLRVLTPMASHFPPKRICRSQ